MLDKRDVGRPVMTQLPSLDGLWAFFCRVAPFTGFDPEYHLSTVARGG